MRRIFQSIVASAAGAFLVALYIMGQPAAGNSTAADAAGSRPKNYVETSPGTDVKFEMIGIPGGTFMMGTPEVEKGRLEEEGPVHPVQISPFWMGKTEVTWDEFDPYWKTEDPAKEDQEFLKTGKIKSAGDALTRPTRPYGDETFGLGREGYPVISVTHHAAMQYCRWLSLKTGKTYRLPTEAEWEYACRAGTKTAFSFGDDPARLGDYAWYAKNSEEIPHPVAQKKPNPWGLYDMHGNVAEWCLDSYKKDAYKSYSLTTPTLGPVVMPTENRFPDVARGGSWLDALEKCRSGYRRASNKTWIRLDPQKPQSIWWLTSAEFVGFRVVRPVEEQDNLKNVRSMVTRESP